MFKLYQRWNLIISKVIALAIIAVIVLLAVSRECVCKLSHIFLQFFQFILPNRTAAAQRIDIASFCQESVKKGCVIREKRRNRGI